MSSYVQSHQTLRDHPRKDELAERLFSGQVPDDIADLAAIGILHRLWWWALDYAEDGDLSRYSDRQVARGCRWQGDPTALVQALQASGFITESRAIHDWDDYAGALIARRLANRERMRNVRAQHVQGTSKELARARNDDVQGTSKELARARNDDVQGTQSANGACKEPANWPNMHSAQHVRSTCSARAQHVQGERRVEKRRVNKDLNPLAIEQLSDDAHDDEFEVWWRSSGRIGSKADARELYRWWRHRGASSDELLRAVIAYREHCRRTDCRLAHGRTFLAKNPCRWREWADGEEHGSMDVRAEEDLVDVIQAASAGFGLGGGNASMRTITAAGGSARAAQSGEDDSRRLPALELGTGE